MSSDVVPIEPEPPPTTQSIIAIQNSPNCLIPSSDYRYYEKITRALYDTGADDCTTDNPYIIFDLGPLPQSLWITLYDAGRNAHHSRFGGWSILRLCDGSLKRFFMRYTPSMRITAVDISKLRDPDMKCLREGEIIDHEKESYSYRWLYENGKEQVLPLIKYSMPHRNIERYYTGSFARVNKETAKKYNSMSSIIQEYKELKVKLPSPADYQVQVRSRLPVEATRVLWHHRFMHMNDNVLVQCNKAVDGVPRIKPGYDIDKCQGCMVGKLRKVRHKKEIKYESPAMQFLQHIHCDYGFMVQKSKDDTRYKRLSAYNGDTCYLVIQCRRYGFVLGLTSDNKSAPLRWLHYILTKYAFNNGKLIKNKTVRFDGDGENDELIALFQHFQYDMETTGNDNSAAIGGPERFHLTVKAGIRSTLESVNMSTKVWNFAFYHYIRIYNTVPHGKDGIVPYTSITGKRVDHSRTRIFGCPIVALKNGKRPALDDHTRRGRFVGYDRTMTKILYLPQNGSRIPLSTAHAVFDELFTSVKSLPPVAISLRRALGREDFVDAAARRPVGVINFDILSDQEQFARIDKYTLYPNGAMPHGFVIETDLATNRGYITDTTKNSLARTIKRWRINVIGSYVTRINDTIVFTKEAIIDGLDEALQSNEPFSITFSRETLDPLPKSRLGKSIPRLQLDQIRSIASIRTEVDIETGEDALLHGIKAMTKDIDLDECADSSTLGIGEDEILSLPLEIELPDHLDFDSAMMQYGDTDDLPQVAQINKTKSKPVASKTSQFTRRELKLKPNWNEWRSAEWKQLDEMVRCNMFGKVVMRYEIQGEFDVIRIVWSYVIKLLTQAKKARVCGNGKPLKPKTKMEYKTFAACTSMTGMRIEISTAAFEGRLLYAADAVNAFAQSGPLKKPCYLMVDEAFREWYYERYKIMLPANALVELLSSIQGHPDAGGNWQAMVNTALQKLKFIRLVHEPCLYRKGEDPKKDVLMCRQVDDLLFSVFARKEFEGIVNEMKKHMNIEAEPELCKNFNGCEIDQRNEYIAIRVHKYILKLVETYGWSQENYTRAPKAPLSEALVKEIVEAGKGPLARSPEGIQLQEAMGFSYRALLGGLIFACVVVRLDIAYSLSLLSRFAEYPARVHYLGLKSVTKYLRTTADRAIVYWRRVPRTDLEPGDIVPLVEPEGYVYPYHGDPYLVSASVDASHATCMQTRRSTGGHIIMLYGSAIAWMAKLQPVVATSSTEAEFMQAVLVGKAVKWIRHIMNGLNRKQIGPSRISEDNKAAIMMVNQQRPTTRTRHIDTQWFAIQEWKETGEIIMEYIKTGCNPSDAVTKALGTVLHHRHSWRSMGYYGSPYVE